MKFYVAIASALAAKNHCVERRLDVLTDEWSEYIDALVKAHAPSGAGFDNGTHLNVDKTQIGGNKPQRLVFDVSFHHMSEHGYYTHWTHHEVWVYPWFDGFSVRVTGRDDNFVKDLIADTFSHLGNVEVMSMHEWRVPHAQRSEVQS
jgi:hypothetical protein